ncbi:MAG TPA: XRE family transcriptional regulator [Fibrobacter sp.]|nr:XRE family transcriptional regulator [Fibrobacter sp.]
MNSNKKTYPPGATVAESILFLKMDRHEFARRLGVDDAFLVRLIVGEEPITTALAESLEAVTGSPTNFWKMLESKYRRSLL